MAATTTRASAASAATAASKWSVQLLGDLSARRDDVVVARFQNSKVASLLGLLAFDLRRKRSRDELIEAIWPEADVDSGRHCLRQALTTLRQRFERGVLPLGSVVIANREHVQLSPETVEADVDGFLRAVRAADQTDDPTLRGRLLADAADLYRGDLLPGYYDDWVIIERERLAAVFTRALRGLVRDLDEGGETERALDYALRAATVAPDREDLHLDAMRLYCRLDRQPEALRQYDRLARILRDEYGRAPSQTAYDLARQLRRDGFRAAQDRPRRARKPGGGADLLAEEAAADGALASDGAAAEPLTGAALTTGGESAPLTRFFGREEEVALLSQLVARPPSASARSAAQTPQDAFSYRLVTLTGPGGCGKTRLAHEMARRLAPEFAGGALFVSLAAAADAEAIAPAILRVAQEGRGGAPSPRAGAPPLEQVVQCLGGQPRLLVLDNLEHLTPAAAQVVRSLLARLPELSVLATSRQCLRADGECDFPVQPLAVPRKPGTPDRLMEFASVQLFLDRARAASPAFRMTPQNAPAIAALCERLEGIPLAIELAAGRAHVLTPTQMLVELADRFGFLVSRRETREHHHSTLREAIGWSYDRLSPPLQRFFTRLCVFRGGWDLNAARSVCGAADALDCLDELTQRSLVIAEERRGVMRYRMLETLREFAAMRAAADAAEGIAADEDLDERLGEAHAAYYAGLAEEAEPHLRGPHREEWVATLDADHENLRKALGWLQARGRAAGPTGALWRYWSARGCVAEGLQHLRTALDAGGPTGDARGPDLERARALLGVAALSYQSGDADAADAPLRESEALYAGAGDHTGLAAVLTTQAVVAHGRAQHDSARALFERSLALRQETGDQWGVAGTLNNLARLAQDTGDFDEAARCYERSRELYTRQGDAAHAALVLGNLGTLSHDRGDLSGARACFERSLDLFRQIGDRSWTATSLHNAGEVACRQGDVSAGCARLLESLTIRQEIADLAGMALSLAGLGIAAGQSGDFALSVRLLAAADSLQTACGVPLRPAGRARCDAAIAEARSAMPPNAFAAAWRYGALLSPAEAVAAAAAALTPRTSDLASMPRTEVEIVPARHDAAPALLAAIG